MKYFLILLLSIVMLIVSVKLGSSNNQIVTFNYLIAKVDYPVSTLLAIFFVVGFVLGGFICGVCYVKALILLLKARRKIKRLERQLIELPKSEHDATGVALVTNKKR